MRSAQPTPTDEVKTTLYFVGQIFWDALPEIYRRMEIGLHKHYPDCSIDHSWFRLASWIGGNRDGNPNVTSEVTAETLHLHRGLAVENHRRAAGPFSKVKFDRTARTFTGRPGRLVGSTETLPTACGIDKRTLPGRTLPFDYDSVSGGPGSGISG